MAEVEDGWVLLNENTGETRKIVKFEKNEKGERWEKVYAKSLARMLDIAGDERTRVLAFLIKRKDHHNKVTETVRSIAAETGISATTVNKTLQLLQKHSYLHKVRNGVYRFSPNIMVNGNHAVGAVVYQEWTSESQVAN